MKYIIVLGDGMADEPLAQLQNQTPMEFAKTPMMDLLASQGEVGLVDTIPAGMSPGSDVANLSVLGYDSKLYYSGRSPLEALSIGVDMSMTDVSIRCNLMTLSEENVPYEERTVIDHSASEITTEEAAILLTAVKQELETEIYKFYVGTSYRHLLVWDKGQVIELTPPHDILGQKCGGYLPQETFLRKMQERSYEILSNHPINQKRKEAGLNPANTCWFWGAGTKPNLVSFTEKTGKRGAMISAVDLLKGIAVGAKMKSIDVEGANGGLHTNYKGKADAALEVLTKEDYDFVYIHLEGPDEMGHQGKIEEKIQAIEYLDEKIIKYVKENLDKEGIKYRMLILPDHPTPIHLRTHTSDPVPYLLYDSTNLQNSNYRYNEKEAKKSGKFIAKGYEIIDYLFS